MNSQKALLTVVFLAGILMYLLDSQEVQLPQPQRPEPTPQTAKKIDYRAEMISFIQQYEGGMSNHRQDPGGWTNKGVTFSTFKLLAKNGNYIPSKANFIAMPDTIWNTIFDLHWNRFAKVQDPAVRAFCTDYFWASGTTGLFQIQKAVRVHCPEQKITGWIGQETIANINSIRSDQLLSTLYRDRQHFLNHLGHSQYFAKGWMKRVNALMDKFETWQSPLQNYALASVE